MGAQTRLRAGRHWVLIPTEARDFYFLRNVQTGFGSHPGSYSKGSEVLFS